MRKFCLLFVLMLGLFGVTLSGNMVFASEQTTVSEKAYSYEVKNNGSMFSVSGSYKNLQTYTLANAVGFEEIIPLIDADRVNNGAYEDCLIDFDYVTLGGAHLEFYNGNYYVSGAIFGLNYSVYGLVYIDGANVSFGNIVMENTGHSPLIRNVGSGDVTFINGQYFSAKTVVENAGSGSVHIWGGIFESQSGSVIEFNSGEVLAVSEKTSLNETMLTTSGESVINISAGEIVVTGGTLTSLNNQTVINATNSEIFLAYVPQFETSGVGIMTNSVINASFDSANYNGEKILVEYTGTLEAETLCITNVLGDWAEKFDIVNENYNFKLVNNNLYIAEVFTVSYNNNGASLPAITDQNEYFYNDACSVKFYEVENAEAGIPLNKQIRENYIFLGWNTDSTAETALYEFGSNYQINITKSVTLYAIWQAVEFSITYQEVAGAENNNATSYTVEDEVILSNPTKQYFEFTGWTSENLSVPTKNVKISAGSVGDKVFTANWVLASYKINYHNLSTQVISDLELKTSYTIEDEAYYVSLETLLAPGYSYYGVYYDAQKTKPVSETINFDLTANSDAFNQTNQIGTDINLYVDVVIFHTGSGAGTMQNPYIINTAEQFKTFISGYKHKSNDKIYININNNIQLSETVGNITQPLENFYINGQNNTITISQFNQFNNYVALFPAFYNGEIKNLILLSNTSITFETDLSVNIAPLVASVQNANIINVKNYVDFNVNATALTGVTNINVAGLIAKFYGTNSVINDCYNYGNVSVNVCGSGEANIYLAGIIGFYGAGVWAVNSANFGNLELTIENGLTNANSYIAGLVIFDSESKLVNSFNYGNITHNSERNFWGVVSGLVIIFNSNCWIYNVVNFGDINTTQAQNLLSTNIVWSSQKPFELRNAYALNNNKVYQYQGSTDGYVEVESPNITATTEAQFKSNAGLSQLNEPIADINSLIGVVGVTANKWYFNEDLLPEFNPTLVVHYDLNGIDLAALVGPVRQNETIIYQAGTDLTGLFVPFAYKHSEFAGWYLDAECSQKANLSNITDSSITLYAKWIPLESVVQSQFNVYIVVHILILVLFIIALYFFDKKKTVTFVYGDKVIEEQQFARTQEIIFPKKHKNKLWFTDVDGEKPLTNNKMPFHKLTLYVFDDAKQKEKEKAYYDKQALLQSEKEALQKEKAAAKAQREKLAEEKRQERDKQMQIKKAEKEKKQTKQTKKKQPVKTSGIKKTKSKQVLGGGDSKITVIKKEIKIIKKGKQKK